VCRGREIIANCAYTRHDIVTAYLTRCEQYRINSTKLDNASQGLRNFRTQMQRSAVDPIRFKRIGVKKTLASVV
jgi:hypothetical protein